MIKKNVDENWKFWKDIVLKKDGSVNISQVKKELSDFSNLMDSASTVYCHVTGNKLSKVGYDAITVTGCADEYSAEMAKEQVMEFIADLRENKIISEKVSETLMEHVDVYY